MSTEPSEGARYVIRETGDSTRPWRVEDTTHVRGTLIVSTHRDLAGASYASAVLNKVHDALAAKAEKDCVAWDSLIESLGIDLRADGCIRDGREKVGFPRPMGPNKYASPRCESGKHNYCTCDTCF